MAVTPETGKAQLRKRLRELRSQIPPEQKYFWDNAITHRVLRLPEYEDAELVLVYLSTAEEIGTEAIIAHALFSGKQVAVPRCRRGSREMDFCLFSHSRQLTDTFWGIPQPGAEAAALSRDAMAGAFCVTPALAAAPDGHRLGYGGGYYDRFLAGFPGVSAALAYDGWAFPNGLKPEPLDVAVEIVVTPENVFRP